VVVVVVVEEEEAQGRMMRSAAGRQRRGREGGRGRGRETKLHEELHQDCTRPVTGLLFLRQFVVQAGVH